MSKNKRRRKQPPRQQKQSEPPKPETKEIDPTDSEAIFAELSKDLAGEMPAKAPAPAQPLPPPPVARVADDSEAPVPNGLLLQEALMESKFLYRAARPLLLQDERRLWLMSDGKRFWAVSPQFNWVDLEILTTFEKEALRRDWRPVLGSETGWRVE